MPTAKKSLLGTVTLALLTLAGGCISNQPPQATNTKTTPSTISASFTPDEAALLENQKKQLYKQLLATLSRNQGARPDGYVYTVDFSQSLLYAALNRDRKLYTTLREFIVKHLIIDNPSDPYTRGFVLWRYREGSPADASGTTEALRLAQSLWLGSQVFGDKGDRDQAILILKGYTRHANTDNGIWLIRNYFNFQTRAFANNSFLVDYDPDFLHEVAQATGDPTLQEVAQKSSERIRQAVTPSGLLYDIIQPEVLTLVPELKNLTIFSPNDVVKLTNTCNVAERVTVEAPDVGKTILRFAVERLPELHTYYYGRTGEPVKDQDAGAPTYACLVRLAVKLKDQKALDTFLDPFAIHTEFVTQHPKESSLYTVVEVLLALQSVLEQNK